MQHCHTFCAEIIYLCETLHFSFFLSFLLYTTLPDASLSTPSLSHVGPSLVFRTALILHSIYSTRWWTHSLIILVHIDMITSQSCCRFVSRTFMLQIPHSTTSKMCSVVSHLQIRRRFRQIYGCSMQRPMSQQQHMLLAHATSCPDQRL